MLGLVDFEGVILFVFLRDKLQFVPLSYRACLTLFSDHDRIWLGSWPKLCPLFNHQVRDMHVKCLQCFLLHRSRKALPHSSQKGHLFYSRSLWVLLKKKFTSSCAHLTTPGAASTCSALLLERRQQKFDNLSYACIRRRSFLYVFLSILTVPVEKSKPEY